MKSRLIRNNFFVVLVLTALVGLVAEAAAADPNLMSHWKFDEGSGTVASDSIGDNNGTIYGPNWTTGQVGGALSFDGDGDYVDCGNGASINNLTIFSVSLWFKADVIPSSSGDYFISQRDLSSIVWAFILHGDFSGRVAGAVIADGSNAISTTDFIPNIGEWYHGAMTYDDLGDRKIRIYINGTEQSYLQHWAASGTMASNPSVHVAIGNRIGGGRDFGGSVDEVSIYNRALSAEEIQQLYQNGVGELIGLEITGPEEVAENFSASYKAISHYDNNSTKDVTDSADWQVEPNTIVSIDDSGLLTTEDIDASEDATIYAQYTVGEVTVEAEKAVTIFNICPTGTALEFDGIDDYVEVGDKSILDFAADDSFTLLAWIKSDKAISAIVGKRRSTGAGGVFKEGYNLGIHLGVIEFGVEDVSGNRTGILHSGATVLNDDTWHHVVAVRDTQTGELRAYVDGFVDAPAVTDSTTTTLATSKSFQIGRRDTTHHGSNPNYFGGKIDDVRIYNRALSAEEIQANMHTRLTGVEPGLVAYWDFDEGEGQIVYDLSPNGNDGQLGSTPNPDNSDPAWAESDAPVGICTPVEVDIKPGSCPNPLNVASKGVLPVAILGSDTFDVTTIDAASIFLDGVPAIRSSLEDVAAPASDGNECDCNSPGPDGYSDLTLKFRTHRVVEELIDWPGELAQGETLLLTLTGELSDGTAIEGTDCVVLVGNVPRWLAARASDINEDGIINMLDLARLAAYWLESSQLQ